MKKTYHRILQKSPRLEDVHKEKKVREQDEENKKRWDTDSSRSFLVVSYKHTSVMFWTGREKR